MGAFAVMWLSLCVDWSAQRQQFLHGRVALIHGLVGVSRCGSVGIGNGNPSVMLARDIAWTLAFGPIPIPQRVVLVGITVGPAVDSNSLDVARGVEASSAKNSGKLIADIPLKRFKRSSQ